MEVTKVRSIFRRFRVSREDAVFYANSERHASFPRMRATNADVTANYYGNLRIAAAVVLEMVPQILNGEPVDGGAVRTAQHPSEPIAKPVRRER